MKAKERRTRARGKPSFLLPETSVIAAAFVLVSVVALFLIGKNSFAPTGFATVNVSIEIVSGGNISVNVSDAGTNEPISEAAVVVKDISGTETIETGTTNSSGFFASGQLLPATYTV